jgi:hypothetical protein
MTEAHSGDKHEPETRTVVVVGPDGRPVGTLEVDASSCWKR